MRIAVEDLPGGVSVQIEGKRAEIAYGDPEAPTLVSAAVVDGEIILFPERSYRHEELARVLGLKS